MLNICIGGLALVNNNPPGTISPLLNRQLLIVVILTTSIFALAIMPALTLCPFTCDALYLSIMNLKPAQTFLQVVE